METFFITELEEVYSKDERTFGVQREEKFYADLASKSIKFRLPDGGRSLPGKPFDSDKELLMEYFSQCSTQRLPYKLVSLENSFSGESEDKVGATKRIIILWESDEGNEIFSSVFFRPKSARKKLDDFYSGRLSPEANSIWPSHNLEFKIDKENEIVSYFNHYGQTDDLPEDQCSRILFLDSMAAALEFLFALSLSNCKTADEPSGREKLNKKRQKSGKPPFYSYKVLTIAQHGSGSGGDAASGRSPRVHLRRGHIRRLSNKTVWVNAAVVGDKSKGFAAKDYAIAAQA